jgi:hypothetical protein
MSQALPGVPISPSLAPEIRHEQLTLQFIILIPESFDVSCMILVRTTPRNQDLYPLSTMALGENLGIVLPVFAQQLSRLGFRSRN